ncbi:hypothetical protein JCM6882_009071 [Rhodosporidiobolus microsporus]
MAYHPQPQPIPPLPAPLPGLGQSSFSNLALSAVLEDLCARFIVNLPAEELESMDRVCFQIEQAHWYYEDFIRPTATNPSLLPSYGLKAFSLLMFKSCPLLHDLLPSHGKIWTSFMAYKERVPVCGAVMINEFWDKVLLVKGWSKGSSWSFPRGKINKQEPEAMCAVREVLEETGCDLTPYFPPHQLHPSYQGEEEGVERVPYYVELVIREQKIRLYFVPNVPEGTRFETRTRKEISKIDWFPLSSLPTWSKHGGKNPSSTRTKGELANGKQAKFYMVTPFISHLKLWVDRNKPKSLPPRPSPSSSTIPLSPEADSPRPLNPAPHHAFFGGHPLVPWSDDSTSHLPSETEQEHSESSVTTSTEDEDSDDEAYAAQRQHAAAAGMQTWGTRQEGTDALQALFFGSPTAQASLSPLPPPPPLPAISSSASASSRSQHATPPARPLPVAIQHHSSSSSLTQQLSDAAAAATPPQVAYERQQSFLQPRAQQSKNQQGQQARLLELLTGQGLSTPPPPAPAVAPVGPQQDGTGSLLGLLNNMHLTSSSTADAHLPPPPSQTHASILFGGAPAASSTSASHRLHNAFSASPPPEALLDSVTPESARGEDEKREKHNALLRALFSVAAKSPPQPPPHEEFVDEGDALVPFGGAGGSLAIPRSDELESLFHSGGSSASNRAVQGGSGISDLHELDEHGWPVPSGPPLPMEGNAFSTGGFYSLPNEQLAVSNGGVQAPTPLTQGGWHSLSSSDEASDGSRRRVVGGPTARQGKGSLLAILNQHQHQGSNGYDAHDAPASSPSAYSSAPAGAATSDEESAGVAVKDPLQVLREYRARQLGLDEPSPPVQPPQPLAVSVSPPQPQQPAYQAPPPPLPPQQQHAFYSPPQPAPPPIAPVQPPYPSVQAVMASMPPQQPSPLPTFAVPPSSQPPSFPPGYPAAAPLPPPQQAYAQPLPPPAPQQQPQPYSSAPLASPQAYPAIPPTFPPQPQQPFPSYSQPLPPAAPAAPQAAPYPSYSMPPAAPPAFPPHHQQQPQYAPAPPLPPSSFPQHFPPSQAPYPPQMPPQGYPSSAPGNVPALAFAHQPPPPPVQAQFVHTQPQPPHPNGVGAPPVAAAGANRGALLGLLNARG